MNTATALATREGDRTSASTTSEDRMTTTHTRRRLPYMWRAGLVAIAAVIAGAIVVTTASPALATTTPQYSLFAWKITSTTSDNFATPQTYIAHVKTDSTDLNQLATLLPCGAKVQIDLYLNNSTSDALVGKQLVGPGNPTEPWPGGAYKSEYSKVVTTAACQPTLVTVPALEVLPPTCDRDGSLAFAGNPAAQNPNGFEFPGLGFRVYLDKPAGGAGVYVATIQKIGAGFDPAFPYGTKETGETKQTLTVLAATGVTQSTDPAAACYVAPPKTDEPPVVGPPVDTQLPTISLAAPVLAHTGVREDMATGLALVALLALIAGGVALLATRPKPATGARRASYQPLTPANTDPQAWSHVGPKDR